MLRSFAALLFIGSVAAVGILVATRPTVIKGEVIASDLLVQLQKRGIERVDCEPAIPFTATGASFQCTLSHHDGSIARVRYKMSRAGSIEGELVDSAPGAPRHHKPGADPWAE